MLYFTNGYNNLQYFTFQNNLVSNNSFSSTVFYASYLDSTTILFDNNQFIDNSYQFSWLNLISITNGPNNANFSFTNNTFDSNYVGSGTYQTPMILVQFNAAPSTQLIANNTFIRGSGWSTLRLTGQLPFIVQNNFFFNNSVNYELDVESTFSSTLEVDARFNYWGVIDEVSVQAKIFDNHINTQYATANYWPFLLSPNISDIGYNAARRPVVVNCTINGVTTEYDITLNTSCPIYYIVNSFTVGVNTTVTLLPGVVFQFETGASLIVDGTLVARGNSTNRIMFLPNSTSTAAGQWQQISFSSTSVNANFDNNGNYMNGSIIGRNRELIDFAFHSF